MKELIKIINVVDEVIGIESGYIGEDILIERRKNRVENNNYYRVLIPVPNDITFEMMEEIKERTNLEIGISKRKKLMLVIGKWVDKNGK